MIKLLLERKHILNSQSYCLFLENITFDFLNSKFFLELRLINIFSSHIFKSLLKLSTVVVVLDVSIRNNITTVVATTNHKDQ